jgi:hypothetical protein
VHLTQSVINIFACRNSVLNCGVFHPEIRTQSAPRRAEHRRWMQRRLKKKKKTTIKKKEVQRVFSGKGLARLPTGENL